MYENIEGAVKFVSDISVYTKKYVPVEFPKKNKNSRRRSPRGPSTKYVRPLCYFTWPSRYLQTQTTVKPMQAMPRAFLRNLPAIALEFMEENLSHITFTI